MNSILNFDQQKDEIVWVSPKRGGQKHIQFANDELLEARVAIYHSKKSTVARDQLSISLTSAVMRKMRWVIGDYMVVGHSKDGRKIYLGLAKVKGAGFSVTSSESGKEQRAAAAGKSSRSIIKFSIAEASPLRIWDGETRVVPIAIDETGPHVVLEFEGVAQ